MVIFVIAAIEMESDLQYFEALGSATFFLKGSGVGLWMWVWVVPWCHSPMPHFWDIVGSRDYSMYP